jgi:hypothetical protein
VGEIYACSREGTMENIIDQRVGKKTRRKMYFEYLVKWKG